MPDYRVDPDMLPKVCRVPVKEWGEQIVYGTDCIYNSGGYCEVWQTEVPDECFCFMGEDGMDDTYTKLLETDDEEAA